MYRTLQEIALFSTKKVYNRIDRIVRTRDLTVDNLNDINKLSPQDGYSELSLKMPENEKAFSEGIIYFKDAVDVFYRENEDLIEITIKEEKLGLEFIVITFKESLLDRFNNKDDILKKLSYDKNIKKLVNDFCSFNPENKENTLFIIKNEKEILEVETSRVE